MNQEMTNNKNNFVQLYRYVQGISETPAAFHMWSCISLIAACVADRVWIQWIQGQPIYPHMFTFLIAPSGIGKNIAISAAERLIIHDPELANWVNHYRGKITGPALYDLLGRSAFDEKTQTYIEPNSKVWFVTPELKNSMGAPEMAQSLIETMTELWSACGTTFRDRTRKNAEVVVEDPCINWLAGTTKEWLMKAVTPADIRGGFFARVLPVYYPYMYPKEKVCKPRYPKDAEKVWLGLRDRVYKLCNLKGEMQISNDADEAIYQWYENRRRPHDDSLAPYHNRALEMILKLSIIFALADEESLRIERLHFQLAIKHYWILQQNVMDLIELSAQTPQTEDAKAVLAVVEKYGSLMRSQLLKKVYSKGIDQMRLNGAISALINMDRIERDVNKNGGIIYSVKEGG